MDNEQEDVQKMNEFLKKHKSSIQNTFELEFQDFVNFKDEYYGNDFEDDSSFDIESEDEDKIINEIAKKRSLDLPTSILTEEEREIIESCTDLELKRILILNRTKNMQLMKLHKKISDLLDECEKEKEQHFTIFRENSFQTKTSGVHMFKLAAPYFKDQKYYACPLNEDTTRKRRRGELSLYDLLPPPKWTTIEFDRLANAVRCNFNINRQSALMKQITALKSNNTEKKKTDEIIRLEAQLAKLKDEEDTVPPLKSNQFIQWGKVAEIFLKDKHSASECEAVWHSLVHPDINKSPWTDDENNKLVDLVKYHSFQDWDTIAADLNTQRTAFMVCLHYFSKLCDKFKKNKFSPEEDQFLINVVNSYKLGNYIPWYKVVCHFTNRSRHQLYHRYTYFLSQNHVKRGTFTEAEDILLMILVDKFGRNFKKCVEYMPHRSQVQLKCRYSSNLQRCIIKGSFTSEDDEIILDYVQKYGDKSWSKLAEKLNRCNAQIRKRYKVIKSFLAANPNRPISEMPKRRRVDLITKDRYSFLNYMVEQYKKIDIIPTIDMIEESLQVELKTSTPTVKSKSKTKLVATKLKNIDNMLTDFFVSNSTQLEKNTREAAANVEVILTTLGASLDIPNDFECNTNLDGIDVEILEQLSKKSSIKNKTAVQKLVPPNISTLVGLKSLIIRHKEYKSSQKNKNISETVNMDNEEGLSMEISHHRELFKQRFDALFHWSALLSLEKPKDFDLITTSEKMITPGPSRTYTQRPASTLLEKPEVKRRKIDVSQIANISNKQLVDRSVVEKLIQNGKVNIITMSTIQGSDELPQPEVPQNKPSCSSQNVDDFDDLKKLDVILKSESINNYSKEELNATKNDVELLQEILNYEKFIGKSDFDT